MANHDLGSLRSRLKRWLLLSGLAVLALAVWQSYRSAERQITALTDQQLVFSAHAIATRVSYEHGLYTISMMPLETAGPLASRSHDHTVYAVFDPGGRLIAGYSGLEPPKVIPGSKPHFFQTVLHSRPARAVVVRHPLMTHNGMQSISVLAAETPDLHDGLLRSLWFDGFLERAVLVFFAMILVWIGIHREMRPLDTLRHGLVNQPIDGFEPFDASAVHAELRPLVEKLNSNMKWRRQLRRQRRFLESAAHQLRTPLAIMKTQVGHARRSGTADEISATLRQIDESLTSLGRMASQLLALGRVEYEQATRHLDSVNLVDVAREVVAEAAPRGLDCGVELVFDPGAACPVRASPTLVRELVRNLVDNAVRYAGAGATAVVSVQSSGRDALLKVDDDGIGVDPADRVRLAGRFRRVGKSSPEGSGLGLSIVAEIAETYGGTLDLPVPRRGHGFCAAVRFPLASPKTPGGDG